MIPHRPAIVVWFVLILLAGRAAQAIDHTGDTRPYWTGRIEQDTTWRDTVYVGGDVTIAAAATLTLAPNTQVHFLPYHDATQGGLDSTRAELIVEGQLAAQAGGIVFRSADAGSLGADWYGLVVERGGIADVSHAAIRDGLRCVYAKRGGRVIMDAISFVNCGKPTAPADAARLSISRRSAQPRPALNVAVENPVIRIAKKLGAGVLGGSLGVLVVFVIGESADSDSDPIAAAAAGPHIALIGYTLGSPIGMSRVDSRDKGILTWAGSIAGWFVGRMALERDTSWPFAPLIGATLASELWRKPPQDSQNSRVSVRLGPAPNGGLSAVATLRF